MYRTNAERRQDMSSPPTQRHAQRSQQALSSSKRSTPSDKENVVYDSQQRYSKQQHTDDVVKSPQKWMNGPLSFKTTQSSIPSFPQHQPLEFRKRRSQPTNTNGALFQQDASNVFAVVSNPAMERHLPLQGEPPGPIHQNSNLEEKRRRCSDPVAAFLHRQFDQENDVPLQKWTNNWREVHPATPPMRPKPIRPTAILP